MIYIGVWCELTLAVLAEVSLLSLIRTPLDYILRLAVFTVDASFIQSHVSHFFRYVESYIGYTSLS